MAARVPSPINKKRWHHHLTIPMVHNRSNINLPLFYMHATFSRSRARMTARAHWLWIALARTGRRSAVSALVLDWLSAPSPRRVTGQPPPRCATRPVLAGHGWHCSWRKNRLIIAYLFIYLFAYLCGIQKALAVKPQRRTGKTTAIMYPPTYPS